MSRASFSSARSCHEPLKYASALKSRSDSAPLGKGVVPGSPLKICSELAMHLAGRFQMKTLFSGKRNGRSTSPSLMPEALPLSPSISGATPRSGILEYRWDLTDQSGERVPGGVYVVKLEGTLYWSSRILFSARIDTEREEIGDVLVTRSEPENPENEDMLEEFSVVFG